jgi:hypothetical protein
MKTSTKTTSTSTESTELKNFGKLDLEKNPKIKFNGTEKIILLTDKNPKRNNKNSFSNFELYFTKPEMTINEFTELFMKSDSNIIKKLKNPISWIKWDISQGHIEIQ